ncbi:MAG: GntR family transcriptional regulator [Planctomycetia bacterium]|nr:GntR family transcriptional regulator [Planctomycetia bacterium]
MPTLKQRAYAYIRSAMSTGALAAGDRLSPAALAKEIGISHIPVREAISQLHSEGLAEQCPRRGAFVRQLRRQELVDLIELRKVLECRAAAQAAQRITDVGLDELEKHVRELRRLQDRLRAAAAKDEQRFLLLRDWVFADLAFHMALLRAAGNQCVIKVLGEANVMTRMFGHRTDVPAAWSDPRYTGSNYAVHRNIFVAVRRHDPKAARRAMAVHMNRARKNILQRFDWLRQEGGNGEPAARDFPESVRREVREIERRTIQTPPPSEVGSVWGLELEAESE